MKTSNLLWGALGATILAGSVWAFAQIRVVPNDENVVAKRVQGTWNINVEWTRKLDRDRNPILKTLKFTTDVAVLSKLQSISDRYRDKDIFNAGWLTIDNSDKFPYLITCANGNPQVIWFTPLPGNWLGTANVRTIWIAIGRDMSNDILLWGGDHTWDVSAIYERGSL